MRLQGPLLRYLRFILRLDKSSPPTRRHLIWKTTTNKKSSLFMEMWVCSLELLSLDHRVQPVNAVWGSSRCLL
jgi:hypothetical protein